MTITEFLLARIAEDESGARLTSGIPEALSSQAMPTVADWVETSAARVLAECEAKRRIVDLHHPWGFEYSGGEGCDRCVSPDDYTTAKLPDPERFPCQTLRLLASVYAGHPDYRQEWRP